MKNATKRAEDLKSLMKKLIKAYPPRPMQELEPLDALVRGAMSFDVSDAKAEQALRHIQEEFVDLNELRVATDLEIRELLGSRFPDIEKRVAMITQSLNAIFEREHTMSLDRLKTISKRDARQFLRELPDIHPFVEAYVMLFAFGGHAFPIDDATLQYLREQGIVEEQTTLDEAQRFIEHHLRGEEHYNFFSAVRSAVHAGSSDGSNNRKRSRARA